LVSTVGREETERVRRGASGEASIGINATPGTVYELVTDVTRMGEWSPETVRCQWIDGAVGPAVGARFEGVNQHGKARWRTKPRIVTADPGHEFAFVVPHLRRDLTRWTYRFVAEGAGTTVTESFELLEDIPWYLVLGDRQLGITDRQGDLESDMRRTLERIKAAVEAPSPAGDARG
jgi:uncharacterized protein YndB with AHSA1/START domain